MRQEEIDVIRQLDLFAQASPQIFDDMMSVSFLQRFPPKVELVRQSEHADFLYVSLEGQVELYATSGSRETVIEVLDPVALFIVAAILNEEVCLVSARTLSACRILMIPADSVRRAMESDINFMRAMVFDMARRYRRGVKEVKNLKLRTSVERLANWLLRMRAVQNHGGYIELPYEKRILASRLGMTPENLSRGFAALSEQGIKVDGSRIVFVDVEKLENFANIDPSIDAPEPT